MKLQIKSLAGSILFESEAESLRELLIGAVRSRADLSSADLSSADLSGADLRSANLRSADLSGADLRSANLRSANLRSADLSGADLSSANLRSANLRSADLSSADLRSADLRSADLSSADLSSADLRSADLRSADLSSAKGLKNFDSLEWFRKSFKRTPRGVIVYKAFGLYKDPPTEWKIEPGSVISENCNPNPTDECGCGVNFATRGWIEKASKEEGKQVAIWRCLIPWVWLPGVVIPWNTDGKARCSKLILLKREGSK